MHPTVCSTLRKGMDDSDKLWHSPLLTRGMVMENQWVWELKHRYCKRLICWQRVCKEEKSLWMSFFRKWKTSAFCNNKLFNETLVLTNPPPSNRDQNCSVRATIATKKPHTIATNTLHGCTLRMTENCRPCLGRKRFYSNSALHLQQRELILYFYIFYMLQHPAVLRVE